MTTAPIKVEVVDWWGTDRDVAHQAWASTYDLDRHEARTEEDVRRVVTGVIQNEHGTPKERVWVDFAITCPIAVERQFDKYRMTVQYQDFQVDFLESPMGRMNITQNELSGRYRTIPSRWLELPDDVAEIQSRVRRFVVAPLSSEEEECTPEAMKCEFFAKFNAQDHWYRQQLDELKFAQDKGIITNAEYKRSREVLRMVLGVGFLTDMRILANLHAIEWILQQRAAAEAQPESQQVARGMLAGMKDKGVAPIAVAEMEKRLVEKGIRVA